MNMYSKYRWLRYELKGIVESTPTLYLPFAESKRRDRDGATPFRRTTRLVLEAFPRSGNTFAYFAFQKSQPAPVEVAHHLHVPANLIAAARSGTPALLIVRQPEDAVSSCMQRQPWTSAGQLLRGWIRFHSALLPYRSKLVIATFDEVISDFGKVIESVNSKFGTHFGVFEHTQKNVDTCFEEIDKRNASRFGGGAVVESKAARPSSIRMENKQKILEEINSETVRRVLSKAEKIYIELSL